MYCATCTPGQTIVTELYLMVYNGANTNPSVATKVSLEGLSLSASKTLVLCNTAAVDTIYGAGTCDSIVGTVDGGPVDSNGDDQLAIVIGDPVGPFTVLDLALINSLRYF